MTLLAGLVVATWSGMGWTSWHAEWDRAGWDLDRPESGEGVRLAVIGPGVDTGHPAFSDRIYRDEVFPGAVVHPFVERPATHALAVAAGHPLDPSGPFGAVPDAQVGVYRTSLSAADFLRDTALSLAFAADDDASVVLLTRGLETDITEIPDHGGSLADRLAAASGLDSAEWHVMIEALRAMQSEAVIVQPAIDHPAWDAIDLMAGLPTLDADIGRSWITAVALDESGALLTAPCGAARDWCVAAPGAVVLAGAPMGWPGGTQIGNANYEHLGGGLVAAARIAAAAALMEETLGLSPENAARKIRDTASTDHAGYDPDLHGTGLLDIAAAMAPVPPLSVPVPTPDTQPAPAADSFIDGGDALPEEGLPEAATPAHPITRTRIIPGASFGNGFQTGLAPFRTLVLDRYGAGYTVDLRSLVEPTDPAPTHDLLAGGSRFGLRQHQMKTATHSLRMTHHAATSRTGGLSLTVEQPPEVLPVLTDAPANDPFAARWGWGALIGVDDPGAFAVLDPGTPLRPGPRAIIVGDPFTDMVADASGAGIGFRLTDGKTVEGVVYTGRHRASGQRVDGAVFRRTTPVDDAAGEDVLRGGLLIENGSMLGTRLSGALGDNGFSITGYLMAARHRSYFDDRIDVAASVATGTTVTSLKGDTLLLELGPVRTTAINAELGINGLLSANDRLAGRFETPLRVLAAPGRMITRVATAGGQGFETEDRMAYFDARPTGWEARWRLDYTNEIAEDVNLKASGIYREHAGHDADAPSDAAMMVQITARL